MRGPCIYNLSMIPSECIENGDASGYTEMAAAHNANILSINSLIELCADEEQEKIFAGVYIYLYIYIWNTNV